MSQFNQKKILLLNPPGEKIYVRDYYCSKVSKAHYLYHPVDLLMLSGTLSKHHEIRVIDAMTRGWNHSSLIENILQFNPHIIIFLTGVVSFFEDFQFIDDLKNRFSFKAIASGELFLDTNSNIFESFKQLDGAILDFTTRDILTLIQRFDEANEFEGGDPIPNIIYKSKETMISGQAIRKNGDTFKMDIPRHDMFPNRHYRYPFVRRFPFATVLTDFGCPFNCQFCAIGQLGHKVRSVDNVIEELEFVHSLGFKDIYFNDQTFAAQRRRTEILLDAIIERNFHMGFICFTRADVIDFDLLKHMKAAGCHTVVLGIEADNDQSLKDVNKGLTIQRIKEAITWCQKLHLRTVGTFVIGLPGMTIDQAARISRFAIELQLDFASFNVPAPRPGTALRKIAISKGWIDDTLFEMDQSGSYAVMGNENMTADDVLYYRNQASRKFYFRLNYLIKRATNIRTLHELHSHLREMTSLIHPAIFERRH